MLHSFIVLVYHICHAIVSEYICGLSIFQSFKNTGIYPAVQGEYTHGPLQCVE